MSRREYNNVVHDLLGDSTAPADHFIDDTYPNGYDNGSAGLAVQQEQVIAYQNAAETLAARAVDSSWSRLVPGCDVAMDGEATCQDAFLGKLVTRAYRRPLTEGEKSRLADTIALGRAAGDFRLGIQTALEVVLQSPQFLYREELGQLGVDPAGGAEVRLTDYEVASELSFLLSGSMPDDELWNAVEEGRFSTTDDYAREAQRLLASDAAKSAMRSFLHQWLATNLLPQTTKDPKFYPSFDSKMAASMTGELDRFFDAVVWGERGSLRELFTSNQSFVDATLAPLYQVPAPSSDFQPVALDPDVRKGVLSRAGFLTVHSATDSSGPIARGVFVLQSILCAPPAPPPANIPPAPPASDPTSQTMTTRQRFDRHLSSAVCSYCHKSIDGIGFGFEEFDGIGAYRTTENGLAIDSSGSIVGVGSIDGDYRGAGELASRLADSRQLVDCFTRHAYRFAMGDVEPPVDRALGWLGDGFSSDARLTDLFMTLVTSPAFVTRKFETE